MPEDRTETYAEKLANVITHFIGFLLAIAACVALVLKARSLGSPVHLAAYSLFGGSLVLLYLSSTLTHFAQLSKPSAAFQVMDYGSIFVVIAVTFTALIAVAVRETVGWMALRFEWSAAAAGIVIKCLTNPKFKTKPDAISSALYFVMIVPLFILLPYLSPYVDMNGRILLIMGVTVFLSGSAFFFIKRLRFSHAIWHVLTLCASFMHFLLVYNYLSNIRI